MNPKRTLLAVFISLTLAALAVSCGEDDENGVNNLDSQAGTSGIGNFTFSCDGQSGSQQQQQQQQVTFKEQQQQGCKKQSIQFQQSQVDDFDVQLDCDDQVVRVKSKKAAQQGPMMQQQAQTTLPIQDDGKVKGKLHYPQQIQDDGAGKKNCWVVYDIALDGQASCAAQVGDDADDDGTQSLNLRTAVDLKPTTLEELQQAGIAGGPGGPTGSTSTTTTISTSTTTPGPGASPSPTASASPSPTPSSTGIPGTVICEVEDPCPVVAETDASCPTE